MIINNTLTERYRVTLDVAKKKGITPALASNSSYGNNGAFLIKGHGLFCMASDQQGWEHVSVSPFHAKRTPTWEEMCFVKSLFWHDSELVVQYHPPESEYVNMHEYCLHLWKPVGVDMPAPPSILARWRR